MRGSPMGVGTLEEMIDDDHAIVSSTTGPEYYVSIMSFVDKDLLEPGASVLLHHKSVSIVGVLTDDTDPLVSVMKLDKAPTESYADIGGLETQIQEVRESVELPFSIPSSTRRWVSSRQRASSSTALLAPERPCWRRLWQTKPPRHSSGLLEVSSFRSTWVMDHAWSVNCSR